MKLHSHICTSAAAAVSTVGAVFLSLTVSAAADASAKISAAERSHACLFFHFYVTEKYFQIIKLVMLICS